jgi:hypothetical protein
MKHLLTYRKLKESLNESKIKKGSDIVKIMSNPVEWGEDMKDRVFTKGQNFIFADTFYYGQQKALDDLVKSWSPGGSYYEYFKDNYGIEIEIIAKYSDFKAKGKFKKLTDDGVVYVELSIKNVNESVNEGISSEAAYIHQITGSGQDGAQGFIDDNNIDGKKLADYVKQNRNTIEKYNVRDIIIGTGVGANKSFRKRFIKQFLNESKSYPNFKSDVLDNIKKLDIKIYHQILDTIDNQGKDNDYIEYIFNSWENRWTIKKTANGLLKMFESYINEEYDVSGVSRQDLKSILNYLDSNDISYDFDGREEILSFDVTELDKAGQTQMKKWGLEESLNEATTSWSKMMKGVKASESGPWTLIAVQDRKVVGQKVDIRIKDLLPAQFEAMRKEFPRAKIHIEDGTGMVVWSEK